MLIAGFLALLLGALEFGADILMFAAVFAKNFIKTALLLFGKLAVYAVSIWLTLQFFRAFVIAAGIGFGVGFLCCIILYGAIKLPRKNG